MHPRYHEWIDHLFDHPVNDPEWYFDLDAPVFEASEIDYAILIGDTFERSGSDLLRFSDEQVGQGLNYLVSALACDFMYSLKSDDVPLSIALRSIDAIFTLYRDCFARRCAKTLSHLDFGKDERSRLNGVCYMFWDITPLGYLEKCYEEPALREAIFDVFDKTLRLDHPACQESALHGLGEYHCFYPDPVERIIGKFIEAGIANPDLEAYAIRARTGNIL